MSLKDDFDVDAVARTGLEKLGYKQEMTRKLNVSQQVTLAIMAVPYGLAAPIATSLVAGGPVVIIWGWILVSVLTQTLALSLAEICSKYPTSAGAYYWCYRLASPRTRLLASWINGWLTVVGVWTIALSVTFVESFEVILICLSAKAAAGRRPISFALGNFDPSYSGWTPGWSFFIGLLPPAYTFSAIGMIANMAEEVHNPSEILPKAMIWSIPIGALSGVVFLLPILFTLPDVAILLQVSSGQPIGVMFTLIMGSRAGGFGLWFIIFGIGMFCAISISCAASRATWAFARDKAIPFHQSFSKISPHLDDVPVNALLLSTVIQILLGLIYLGSSAAFNAFVGVAVMCLGASYAMPVAILLLNGRKDMHDAPFNLGRFGTVINAVAVLWIMFAIVLFSMPAGHPSHKNYASVVFVGFGVISALWYLINGRFYYTGPPITEESAGSSDFNRSDSPSFEGELKSRRSCMS
ncbi:amino acid transporter [Suillus paluster]|uniref:amino acid transporter n=1 Tax=Suillus paluster TaxID=48578 RepID=UPI001B8618C5|nr:amino acid transporter [Suillus paluster]KAG1744623.1 amino acid transporter [Suillus paluster]